MSMLDLLSKQLDEKGWLAMSSLYFDNGYVINVFNSRGYVARSNAMECFFAFSTMDSTDTDQVENTYVVMRRDHMGMQQTITVVGYDHLQHFDMAQYSHYAFYDNSQEKVPYPKIPTPAELEAMTPNPDTGLYDSADTVQTLSGKEISAISMYNDFFDPYTKDWQYSGAIVGKWKNFYKNHKKFCTFLNDAYGITDAK